MGFFGIIFSLLVSSAHALLPADLKSGDVLLQSIPCYICSLIEIEEGAPYSHIGVVLKDGGEISVLQAWGSVQAMSYANSIGLRKTNTSTLVLRAVDAHHQDLVWDSSAMKTEFKKDFEGLNYDEAFLWDNRDEKGEKLYCSEFAAKFLNHFLPVLIPTQPMHFQQYRQDWINYFHGTPPDGLPGLSPADFLKMAQFRVVGDIP